MQLRNCAAVMPDHQCLQLMNHEKICCCFVLAIAQLKSCFGFFSSLTVTESMHQMICAFDSACVDLSLL